MMESFQSDVFGGIFALIAVSVLASVFNVLDVGDKSCTEIASGICAGLCIIKIFVSLTAFAG